jgi:protein-S-isoprenylcysteine O-methyltransferase Ste14
VERGPYGYSRNPIYLGDTLLLLGLGLAGSWPSLLLGAPIFALAVDRYAIRPEESHLAARFPQDFAAYKKRVRRWL